MARTVAVGDPLTTRELDVLRLLADGHTKASAARHLWVSHSTVKTHAGHALRKLGAHSTVQAVAILARAGLLDPPDTEQTPETLITAIALVAEAAAQAGIPRAQIVVAALGPARTQPATA